MPAKSKELSLGYGDYLRFRDLILERTGLYFPEKKKGDLEIGLRKALAELSLGHASGEYNLDSYYHLLHDKNNPAGCAEMERLIKVLTVGETHFFRDETQFDALANHILPALITRKRTAAATAGPDIRPQLRIWSAGCATGEEPYSLAILLKELLPDIDQWHIHILASDLNPASLSRAKEAVYSEWSFRETRAKLLQPRYFIKDSTLNRYRLRRDIPSMVTFATLNLIEDSYPAMHNNTASMDLILCRNVTIYFHEADTRQVVDRFYRCLIEGGWLVVGHSEPSLTIYRAFQTINVSGTVLYQKSGQATSWSDDWQWPASEIQPPVVDHRPPKDIFSLPDTGTITPQVRDDPIKNNEVDQVTSGLLQVSPAPVVQKPASSTEGPNEVDPYEIACALLNKGQIEEAIKELHRKLVSLPDFAPAHVLLGRAYANVGNWSEARRWCQSALRLNNLLAEAYYILALLHEQEGQIDLAIESLKKAVYLERDTPLYHFNLALLYKKAGQVNRARRSGRNAIKVLEKWPPSGIVPDSGGATAGHLLDAARRALGELEGGD
jgi:chemotaxis protein methyltransferase CheR